MIHCMSVKDMNFVLLFCSLQAICLILGNSDPDVTSRRPITGTKYIYLSGNMAFSINMSGFNLVTRKYQYDIVHLNIIKYRIKDTRLDYIDSNTHNKLKQLNLCKNRKRGRRDGLMRKLKSGVDERYVWGRGCKFYKLARSNFRKKLVFQEPKHRTLA